MITIWFTFATGEPCNLALVSMQIKIVLCYLAWLDSINVIAHAPSVSWTWSAHLRLISKELSLVTATVNVLWENWFKKLELFKVNVLWCFIPILCEFIRILFKDHYLQSLWAATLQVNSHLAANKYGLRKSESKHLPEIQPLLKKSPQACVIGTCLDHSRRNQNFASWNPWHSYLFKKETRSLILEIFRFFLLKVNELHSSFRHWSFHSSKNNFLSMRIALSLSSSLFLYL